jgi:hypothetical protein
VRVQAGDTGYTIQEALVTIEVEGQAPLDGITDSNGVARIFISSPHAGQPGFLIIEAKEYKRYTQNIDLIVDTLPDVILLERLPAVTPTPTFTSVPIHIGPSTEAPTSTLTTIATNTPTSTLAAMNTPTLTPTSTPSCILEFRADKTVVNPGELVTLRWRVENVQAVYLDWKGGAGAPGTGQDTRRMWETTDPDHTLRVVLKNGETITRTITITVK